MYTLVIRTFDERGNELSCNRIPNLDREQRAAIIETLNSFRKDIYSIEVE